MKGRPVLWGLLGGVVMLLLAYFIYNYKPGNTYQWHPSISVTSDQPYGTLFIKKLLQSAYKGTFTVNEKQPINKFLADHDYDSGKVDYILIGQGIYLDAADVTALKDFMLAGNDIFISTIETPKALVDSVYISHCEGEFLYDYNFDTAVYANFYHKNLNKPVDYEFRYRIGTEDLPHVWRSLDPQAWCDSANNLSALGYQQEDLINFMRISYGPGHLYIHTSPLMFTNLYMTKSDKMEYASAVFSHLNGTNAIWDEVSKIPFSDQENPYDSPLYYIMQQPALKYAWWMLLVGGLLYIIFASKRTQRIIPVLETKTNTSLEFLNVISSLHYQNPNHLDMARKKMKYFLYFIRAKYGINTQVLTEEQSKRLAEKSKVDLADIQAINDRYKVVDSYSISNDEPERLIGLYQAIEKFYKNCK